MSNPSKNNQKQNQVNQEMDVEVLYQKLGDRWFAFSIVNDEVFMSPVSDDQIAAAKADHHASFNTAIDEDFDTDTENSSNTNNNNTRPNS
ncbi:MAG: hypothetical protein JST80_06830 [Bdellovibrionales bacterium]|nr:hypothetical protein [Bdellovibrionales bacterium]